MLPLPEASLPVQLCKDWTWMYAARPAATTFPLLVALVAIRFDSRHDPWLAGASGIAAVLATVGALMLLPGTGNRAVMALLTTAGVVRIACIDQVAAALTAAALCAALLMIVLIGPPSVSVSYDRSGR